MNKFIITALILSTYLSIQTHRRLIINQAECNQKDLNTSFFPIGINFTTIMNNQDNLNIGASALVPCNMMNEMKVIMIFNEVMTTHTIGGTQNVVNPSLFRTSEMSLKEMAAWWKEFAAGFENVVVKAKIVVTENLVEFNLTHVNSQLMMTLEAYELKFQEGNYTYDFDQFRKSKAAPMEVITTKMSPEMMEAFKQQLMSKENMQKLLDNVEDSQESMVQVMDENGTKVQVVLQRKIVQMVDDKKNEKFLI